MAWWAPAAMVVMSSMQRKRQQEEARKQAAAGILQRSAASLGAPTYNVQGARAQSRIEDMDGGMGNAFVRSYLKKKSRDQGY